MNALLTISNLVKDRAQSLGFDLVGITQAEPKIENNFFLDWLNKGFAGNMKYIEKNSDKRIDINKVLPNAKSIISCALNYNTDFPYSNKLSNKDKGWIARYAWGDDYHDVLLKKLKILKEYFLSLYSDQHNVKVYVDTGPVLEKVYSQYAGVGWIGKNTCLINQELGSWLLLGEIITDTELEYDKKAIDRCGSCTRCIEACPTDAIVEPYVLDSRKCISYLTIELKEEIPIDLRDGLDNNIFGCDICQDVCPWNRKSPTNTSEKFLPRNQLFNPELEYLLDLNQEEFSKLFKDNPVKRTKRKGLLRNVLVAVANTKNVKFLPFVEKLLNDLEPLIRQHAIWALWKIEGEESLSKINDLCIKEHDENVLNEIRNILDKTKGEVTVV